MSKLVIGVFQPFGGKSVNNAAEVASRLQGLREAGELAVPDSVDVAFVPLQTDADSVARFVEQAREMGADKVLLLGESGLRTHVEARALDRGQPGSLLGAAAAELLPHGPAPALESRAPVEEMARSSGARVSTDPGHYYCNYAYHSALQAGLDAVFVHVPSGVLGFGRQTQGATTQVNQMLETWYLASP